MLSPQTLQHYRALADWLAGRASPASTAIIGINGAQGSGKSTLARALVDELARSHDLRAGILSLDDCYLGHAERQQLAVEVHPLLTTRGVPGTHDVELGRSLLSTMRELGTGETLALPVFSKAGDDRLPATQWSRVQGPFDLILFEGWCVGTPPQREAELDQAVNRLEREEDADGCWRRYVNTQLAGPYADWFAMLDALVFLQVPDFEQVASWRGQQEAETAAVAGAGRGLMSAAQLERFIQHYERLTRHALAVLPASADVLVRLDASHAVHELCYRSTD